MMGSIAEALIEGVQEGNFSLNFTSGGLGLLVYILQAWALYTIAERRGINKPWLAWIPVVNVWILGSISDQYQYVVKRQVKNKRNVLLGLEIAMTAIAIFMVVFIIVGLFCGLLAMEPSMKDGMLPVQTDDFRDTVGALLVVVLLSIAVAVLAIIEAVCSYIALYDIFCSCDPKNSTLYLVLSLVGNVVISGASCIFLMLCKDKDLGMPPRKPEIVEEIPENTEE